MNYLQEAFGGLSPQVDEKAAVKFALSIILMDDRLSELSQLLIDGHELGAVEGDPGWIIERRDSGPSGEHSFYANWPKNSNFHVHVEPKGYELAHPDMFMGAQEFHRYVCKAVEVYIAKNAADQNTAKLIVSQLKELAKQSL